MRHSIRPFPELALSEPTLDAAERFVGHLADLLERVEMARDLNQHRRARRLLIAGLRYWALELVADLEPEAPCSTFAVTRRLAAVNYKRAAERIR
jgi:hypothetical protein